MLYWWEVCGHCMCAKMLGSSLLAFQFSPYVTMFSLRFQIIFHILHIVCCRFVEIGKGLYDKISILSGATPHNMTKITYIGMVRFCFFQHKHSGFISRLHKHVREWFSIVTQTVEGRPPTNWQTIQIRVDLALHWSIISHCWFSLSAIHLENLAEIKYRFRFRHNCTLQPSIV